MMESETNPLYQVILDMLHSGEYTPAEIAAKAKELDIDLAKLQKTRPKIASVDPKTPKPVTTLGSYTDFDEEAAARLGKQTVANKTANQIMSEIIARKGGK